MMKRILISTFAILSLLSVLLAENPADTAEIHFAGNEYVDVWFSESETETVKPEGYVQKSFSREFKPDFSFTTDAFYVHCRICVVSPVTITLRSTPLYVDGDASKASLQWSNISEHSLWNGTKIESGKEYTLYTETTYSIMPRNFYRQFILKATVPDNTPAEYYQGSITVEVTYQ